MNVMTSIVQTVTKGPRLYISIRKKHQQTDAMVSTKQGVVAAGSTTAFITPGYKIVVVVMSKMPPNVPVAKWVLSKTALMVDAWDDTASNMILEVITPGHDAYALLAKELPGYGAFATKARDAVAKWTRLYRA
jgi:hypothetical protein